MDDLSNPFDVGKLGSLLALGKSAIDSGLIKDEADLECSDKLVKIHKLWKKVLRS